MMYYDKGWFAKRAGIYAKFAKEDCLPDKTDSVFFQFGKPSAGWIEMVVFVNGEKRLTAPLSVVYNPFPSIVLWLERIVRSELSEHTLRVDCEGHELYFHYEMLYEAEVYVKRHPTSENPYRYTYERGDVNTNPELGLFYVYDSSSDSIPVCAFCVTKEMINALYLAMLSLATKHLSDFEREWYYTENAEEPKDKWLNGWTFYNACKSNLIEWNILSPKGFRHEHPSFKSAPKVVDVVHMWCEYADALFWHNGACCGNADYVVISKYGRISLEGINGLRKWYDDWEAHSLEWSEEQRAEWRKQGAEFVQKVRAILPDDIDLCCEFWEPAISVRDEHGCSNSLPMIIFNNGLIEKK